MSLTERGSQLGVLDITTGEPTTTASEETGAAVVRYESGLAVGETLTDDLGRVWTVDGSRTLEDRRYLEYSFDPDGCLMATTRIRIGLDDLAALPGQLEELKRAIIRWAQRGWSTFVLNRLKRVIPVRTGRLRNSLKFRKLKNGGRFFFTKGGFYWIFQDGLEDALVKVINDSLRDLIPWAVRNARREVGI